MKHHFILNSLFKKSFRIINVKVYWINLANIKTSSFKIEAVKDSDK